jgi:hypothetical protein
MSSAFGTTDPSLLADGSASLGQAAGTYDLLTASGDVLIESIAFLVTTAPTLLTSVAVKTSDTTPNVLLAAAALATLLDGAAPAPFTGPLLLRSGKKIQYIIVGLTSAAAAMRCVVRYRPVTAGARLA